jgi:hypothetical protein
MGLFYWTGEKLRKEANIERKKDDILCRFQRPSVAINGIANGLKSIKGNPNWHTPTEKERIGTNGDQVAELQKEEVKIFKDT